MIAELNETPIIRPLVQVASLSMNDLKAIFQMPINPSLPEDTTTLHTTI
jgi:hypothetical protein